MGSPTSDEFRCRIQFVNDIDPFSAASAGFGREPLKPLQSTLFLHRPIAEQLPELIRLLRAPHKSGDCCLQVLSGGQAELSSYLDPELSLSEQPDELYLLQNDP
uniref:FHOD1 N-terminal GTPase-binding domain-containing protein n=1 Tax=Globodera rostochiensis TaxID=31243 RepID=A0A914ICP9_GLORO